MGPRGRPKRKLIQSESGTSVGGDSEDPEEPTTSTRPRRSRVPKRYLDDDYSPPAPKRRATNRGTPSEEKEEEEEKEEVKGTPSVTKRGAERTPATTASSGGGGGRGRPARGRPKKNPTPPRRKSLKQQRQEEDVIYMDEESEDDDESTDDEFVLQYDQQEDLDEDEEDLNLSDIKPNIEEEAFCPWIEDPATLPKMELPESSQDIPIPVHATMDCIEIYEILRSYHRTLRITPFTFEDFCAALISSNNSCIMAEVHMALLRVCLKSDDEEQTQYSVTETNNSVNIMFHHMDSLCYAEILRQYIEAYPFADSYVREAINVENYPYVGYEPKIVVLLFMSYRFLYSSEFKKVVNNMGRFQNDENCRVCGKSIGRIVGCTQCEAAFHVECSSLKPFPEVLICNICKKNSVRGVLPLDETPEKEPLRSQPIGRDRFGRFYWFMCRRIIVQSQDESEIFYYSTPPQLYQLLQSLDRDYYEKDLCEAIHLRIDEFLEQMTLTVELTVERRDIALDSRIKRQMISYLVADSTTAPIYLHKDSMKRMASILRNCASKTVKTEPGIEVEVKCEEDSILPESMLGIFNGCLINTFWSGGASQEELVHLETQPIDAMAHWRMGDEGNDQSFMTYYNYYMRNEMAESFMARKKAADKKKYMASKFSTIEQFEWVVAKDRQFYGDSVLHNKFVQWTLSKISRKIPADLMHRRWIEVSKGFDLEVSVADDYKKLVNCLLQLDAVTRKTIFIQQWWSGLGQTKLERITVDQRDQFVKEQQRIKKLESDALAKELDESFVRVNYMKPKWPNTYILRQKGETYRNAGKGVMGGWAWVAKKYQEKWVPVPKSSSSKSLDALITRITKKRDAKHEPPVSGFDLVNKCYSPACRKSRNPRCYSFSCRNGLLLEARRRHEEEEQEKKGILGEDKPWPIPEIQKFRSKKGGEKSLFVLQKSSRILRQMILTAGCQQVYMPGFSSGIKSNLLIWPYPAPRPTLDLCWKWQVLNSRSLHSVALQLKIMWSSIKWNEFEPDDTHPDRRVVIDTPTHDERRRIIRHKEMAPYGQYERYELEIEIIPLYDVEEEEDESWLSRTSRSTDCSQRTSSNRKKRPQRNMENRQATAIRREWVDGVTLKVFEIKDYWKWVRMEAEKAARRRQEAARKLARAREDEKQRLMIMQRPVTSRLPSSSQTTQRTSVPYMGGQPRRSTVMEGVNGIDRFQLTTPPYPPLRTTPSMTYQSTPRVQPNPVIRRPVQPYLHQNQYQQRVAAGSDYPLTHGSNGNTYRAVLMTPTVGGGRAPQTTYSSRPSNGHQFQNGRVQQGTAIMPQRRVVVTQPYVAPVAGEEALGASTSTAAAYDADDQPPQIPRYDADPLPRGTPIQRRQVYPGQVIRHVHPGPGGNGSVVYLKAADGATRTMVRNSGGGGQEYQRVVVGGSGGTQMISRGGAPIVRQIISPNGTQRFVRVQSGRPGEVITTRRIIQRVPQQPQPQQQPQQYQQQMFQDYMDEAPPPAPHIPQNPRFLIQGRAPPVSQPPIQTQQQPPRGGMTMQMVQQEVEEEEEYHNEDHVVISDEIIYNPADHEGGEGEEDNHEQQIQDEQATGFAQ
uniref:DDT domain-containing protein n=1 Tax=Caenorhabditis tropicalis TaxID=1561998 RepID=A0A1I7U7N0_9PELO